MKPKYLNNLIEDSLFTRMKGSIKKAGLVALVGAVIGGRKNETKISKQLN